MVSFFTCTRPNRSRVGAIDKPDRSEQVFDQYYIPEDPEKSFTKDFSIVGHQKMIFFGVFDDLSILGTIIGPKNYHVTNYDISAFKRRVARVFTKTGYLLASS